MSDLQQSSSPLIGVVGPCTAGKTTLVDGLLRHGWVARQISQEHSFVPDMWQQLTNPTILIYLDVSYPEVLLRRPQRFSAEDLEEQSRRLEHARAHAHFYLMTDSQSPTEVLDQVLEFLKDQSRPPTQSPLEYSPL